MKTTAIVAALYILTSFPALLHAQSCGSKQFAVRNDGEDYIVMSSPTNFKTCGGINICDEINNGKQSLSVNNNELSISNGNTVQLPDASSTNEIQQLAISSDGTSLSISSGNAITLPDSSAVNEIQQLSLSNGVVSLSNGGGSVTLPDDSATNELQQLTLSGSSLSLSNSNSVDLTDATGVIFRASKNTTQTFSSTPVLVKWDWVTVDSSNSYTTSTGVFTASKAGWYQVSLSLAMYANGGYNYFAKLQFYVQDVMRSNCISSASVGYNAFGAQCTDIIYLQKSEGLTTKIDWLSNGPFGFSPADSFIAIQRIGA